MEIMTVLSGIKRIICEYIVVRDCIENGEFVNADTIVVIGSGMQAVLVNILFRGSDKKIYYATELTAEYHYRKQTKWIIFDRSIENRLPQNNFNILFMPKI